MRPAAHSRNAPAIRCHAACSIPPAVDLLRVLSLMGIRGGFAVRRDAGSLIRREPGEVGPEKGVVCAVATLFCESQRPYALENRPWRCWAIFAFVCSNSVFERARPSFRSMRWSIKSFRDSPRRYLTIVFRAWASCLARLTVLRMDRWGPPRRRSYRASPVTYAESDGYPSSCHRSSTSAHIREGNVTRSGFAVSPGAGGNFRALVRSSFNCSMI